MDRKPFDTAYRLWLDDCLAEFNARFTEQRRYHQESLPAGQEPADYEPGQLVEFAEDGSAYPHGVGGTGHVPNAVTPWEQSPHYLD